MATGKPTHASLLMSGALAILLLFLALRGLNWHAMLEAARRGHIGQLSLAMLVLSLSYYLRAVRWRILLRAERPLSALCVFWATMAGYLGNNFLPARAGEILRSVLIARRAAISISFVLATALTERIMDALALALIGAMASLTVQGLPGWLASGARAVVVLGTISIIGLGIASHSERLLRRGLRRLSLPARLRSPADALLQDFLLGLRALQQTRRALSFIGLTATVWLIDALWAMMMARALDLSLTLAQALLLLVTLGLASAAPSTPGYIGIYQFVAVTVLVPFGYSQNQAIVYIIAFQAENYLATLVWGLLGLWQLARPADRAVGAPRAAGVQATAEP